LKIVFIGLLADILLFIYCADYDISFFAIFISLILPLLPHISWLLPLLLILLKPAAATGQLARQLKARLDDTADSIDTGQLADSRDS